MPDRSIKQSAAGFTRSTFKKIAGRERFPQPAVIHLRYPVVFMHGFGMLAVFLKGGHLHDEAMYMRQRGIRAYAPNVSPYHTIESRAEMWKECIEHILEETHAEAVTLIAHSMGGLDARFMISRLGVGDRIKALVTVASPHHGSYLADIVLETPGRVQEWLSDAANWAGTSSMDGVESDFQQAIHDLTPDYVTNHFNPAVPDNRGVAYFSYAGCAGKGTRVNINPLLRLQNTLIYAREGKNDGFISVESAQWGKYLGTINADHSQQIGIDWTPQSTFKSTTFYAGVIKMLAKEGF